MPDDLQYTTINDFRPGIITNQRSGTGGRLILPPGAADGGTQDCMANATGQLVPLPKAQKLQNNLTVAGTPINVEPRIIGLAVEGTTGYVHVAVEYLRNNAGTPQQAVDLFYYYQPLVFWQSYRTLAGVTAVGLTLTATSSVGRIATFVQTRGRRSTFTSPGFPIIAFEWTSFDTTAANIGPWYDGAIYFYEIFPDPNALNVDSTYQETATVNNAAFAFGGPIVAHASRILRFCENNTAHGALGAGFTSNERVRYTDPPNSVSLTPTTTDSILDPQYPGGFGVWGSISFGELLLIKKYGGALLVEGDIYAPQVTRLPGVKGVGGMYTQSAFSQMGLIYCSYRDGAYVWNGSNTSRKISKVDDQFAVSAQLPGFETASVAPWGGDLVAFSNGYVYDTLNDSWWVLSSPFEDQNPIALVASSGGTDLVASSCVILSGTTRDFEIWKWDRGGLKNTTYTWVSQPIQVSANKTVDIREVIITLTSVRATPPATASVTITFEALDGTSATETFTPAFNNVFPTILRKPIGIRANSIKITAVVSSDGAPNHPAPTLNSISFGWKEAQPYGPNS